MPDYMHTLFFKLMTLLKPFAPICQLSSKCFESISRIYLLVTSNVHVVLCQIVVAYFPLVIAQPVDESITLLFQQRKACRRIIFRYNQYDLKYDVISSLILY